MGLACRRMELRVVFTVHRLCYILLRLMLPLHNFIPCGIHDPTVPQVLDVSSVRLAVVAVFLGDRVLGTA